MSSTRVGVLISGSGTNLQALLDACAEPDFPGQIAVVISNRRDAGGLERARSADVPAEWHTHRGHADRSAYDAVLVDALRAHDVEWVCLAGFMRLLTPTLLDAFPQRVLNVHPSLLPAFPGMHGARQALEAGVRVAGCSVHLVDHGTDTGPIVAQGAVPVLPDDDEPTLQRRIQRMEHRLYPRVLRWACEGRIEVEDGRARVRGADDAHLLDPSP